MQFEVFHIRGLSAAVLSDQETASSLLVIHKELATRSAEKIQFQGTLVALKANIFSRLMMTIAFVTMLFLPGTITAVL